MNAIGNNLTGDFRMYKDCTYCIWVAMVHAAHGIKQMGYVQNTYLHAFNHLIIVCIGVSGLQDNTFADAI